MSLNKVFLIGHLGKDPELKDIGKTQVCKFSIATSEGKDDKKKTEWHNIVCFGNVAVIAANSLAKGSKIFIEGKIQTSTWDDKEGKKQYRTEIICNLIEFLDKKEQSSEPEQKYGKGSGANLKHTQPNDTDDIPF